MSFFKYFLLYLTMINRLYIIIHRLHTMINKLITIINQYYVIVSNLCTIINKLFTKKEVFLLIVSKVDINFNESLKVRYFCTKPLFLLLFELTQFYSKTL